MAEGIKKERIYSTITLYMDPERKKKLFFTHTYNFENSSGEEYLIRIRPYRESDSGDRVNRLVFVSGSDPHTPLYRTRLYLNVEDLSPRLSGIFNSGARIAYTTFNEDTVAVTRVHRGTFADIEQRSGGSRSDLSKELEVFGLLISEKKRKEKSGSIRKDGLPKIGVTIQSATLKNEMNVSTVGRDVETKPLWVTKPSEEKKFEIYYICDALKALVVKELKKSPMSIDPMDQELTPISSNPQDINKIICVGLSNIIKDDIKNEKFCFSHVKSDKIEKFIILNDISMSTFELFEGVVNIKLLTCALTGTKFGLRSN